jgi:hypothetical protein
MLRPEIASRIRETNNMGLESWYKRNTVEADNAFYNDHQALKDMILEEANFIAEILKSREVQQ